MVKLNCKKEKERMNGINLTNFYNHDRFMKDLRQAEKLVEESEKELQKLPIEKSDIAINDIIVSSGKGSIIKGIKGKVIDKYYNGKFLRFSIDWDFDSRKKKRYITIERLQDIEKENF